MDEKVTSNEQKVTSNQQKVTSKEEKVTSNEPLKLLHFVIELSNFFATCLWMYLLLWKYFLWQGILNGTFISLPLTLLQKVQILRNQNYSLAYLWTSVIKNKKHYCSDYAVAKSFSYLTEHAESQTLTFLISVQLCFEYKAELTFITNSI